MDCRTRTVVQNKENLRNRSKLLCYLDHMIQQIQQYLRCQWERGIVFVGFGKSPIDELQWRALGFWSKACCHLQSMLFPVRASSLPATRS